MKKEYDVFLKTVTDFLNLLKVKEERIQLMDMEMNNKRVQMQKINDELANQLKNAEMAKLQAFNDVKAVRDQANALLNRANSRLLEVENMRLSLSKEKSDYEQLKQQLLMESGREKVESV